MASDTLDQEFDFWEGQICPTFSPIQKIPAVCDDKKSELAFDWLIRVNKSVKKKHGKKIILDGLKTHREIRQILELYSSRVLQGLLAHLFWVKHTISGNIFNWNEEAVRNKTDHWKVG